uniref:Uncharacterized protein n=1 Tax=Cucumis melo TaxID=3656 RepID=A0A9I9EFJ8_CUCME
MSVGNFPFPDAFWGISRRRMLFYRTKTERGKERRSREPSLFSSPFRRCSAVVPRRRLPL